MKQIKNRAINKFVALLLIVLIISSNFSTVFAISDQRTPDDFANRTYVIGTYEFTSSMALTTSRIMLAARTIIGDDLQESDMIIYYKNSRGVWINAVTSKEIPAGQLPKSFTITHTDLKGESIAVDTSTLEMLIRVANNNKNTTKVSADGKNIDPNAKWVTSVVMMTYTNEITAAQIVLDSENLTPTELDAALAALTQAAIAFDEAKRDGTRVLVNSITVTGSATVVKGQTLELGITVAPANATNKKVIWSVIDGTGKATISNNGLLTATGAGTVTVKATAQDGSLIAGIKEITVAATPAEVLTAKSAAKDELDNYVDADDYTTNAEALTTAIANGKSSINAATTIEAIASALADAKSAIDAIKTDADLAAEALAAALLAVNEAADAATIRSALEAADLGLDLTDYNVIIEARRPVVAADMLGNRPETGFANKAAVQAMFDEIVGTRTVVQGSLDAVNAASIITL